MLLTSPKNANPLQRCVPLTCSLALQIIPARSNPDDNAARLSSLFPTTHSGYPWPCLCRGRRRCYMQPKRNLLKWTTTSRKNSFSKRNADDETGTTKVLPSLQFQSHPWPCPCSWSCGSRDNYLPSLHKLLWRTVLSTKHTSTNRRMTHWIRTDLL